MLTAIVFGEFVKLVARVTTTRRSHTMSCCWLRRRGCGSRCTSRMAEPWMWCSRPSAEHCTTHIGRRSRRHAPRKRHTHWERLLERIESGSRRCLRLWWRLCLELWLLWLLELGRGLLKLLRMSERRCRLLSAWRRASRVLRKARPIC